MHIRYLKIPTALLWDYYSIHLLYRYWIDCGILESESLTTFPSQGTPFGAFTSSASRRSATKRKVRSMIAEPWQDWTLERVQKTIQQLTDLSASGPCGFLDMS